MSPLERSVNFEVPGDTVYPRSMSDYRDKDGALRRQQAALQDDLEVAEHELAEAEAVVAEQQTELEQKDAELARLRAAVEAATPAPKAGKVLAPDGNAICPICQKHNAPHYKFCLRCGKDLEVAGGAPATNPLAPSATPLARSKKEKSSGQSVIIVAIAALIMAIGVGLVLVLSRVAF